jgi:hypothetical protein
VRRPVEEDEVLVDDVQLPRSCPLTRTERAAARFDSGAQLGSRRAVARATVEGRRRARAWTTPLTARSWIEEVVAARKEEGGSERARVQGEGLIEAREARTASHRAEQRKIKRWKGSRTFLRLSRGRIRTGTPLLKGNLGLRWTAGEKRIGPMVCLKFGLKSQMGYTQVRLGFGLSLKHLYI